MVGPGKARALTDSMPSSDVAITLTTARHRSQSRWTSNDIFDLDAMSVAVPYCDIVVTERSARHVLDQAGLGRRLGTKLLASLAELEEELRDGN